MNKEKIEELKKKYPEGIYKGEINFYDEDDKPHNVIFFFRAPTSADIEAFLSTAQKNPIVANFNIIQSLIVHPEPGPVIESIRNYPVAANKFCEEVVLPFFGSKVSTQKTKV